MALGLKSSAIHPCSRGLPFLTLVLSFSILEGFEYEFAHTPYYARGWVKLNYFLVIDDQSLVDTKP